MKIKSDFITNSSSSSFILAIKDGTTLKQISELISENVQRFVDELGGDEYIFNDNFDGFEDFSDEKKFKEVLKLIAREILNTGKNSCINIGDWSITGGECSCEDGQILDTFLYSYMHDQDDEFIKFKTFNG